jgi:ankyrin repeat protein
MWAAFGGHVEIVQELLQAGAKVNAKNNDGETALMWATWRGHDDIVEMLKKSRTKE